MSTGHNELVTSLSSKKRKKKRKKTDFVVYTDFHIRTKQVINHFAQSVTAGNVTTESLMIKQNKRFIIRFIIKV